MSDAPESDTSNWKATLRESNAIGWIAFFGLVIAIGVGTILFGGAPLKNSGALTAPTAQNDNGSSTEMRYLK